MAASHSSLPGAALGFQRVNRAIMVVDVVESVRLVACDELSTIERWLDLVRRIETKVLPQHLGRVVKSLGDGLLVEFADARSAVAAALAVQQEATAAEQRVPAEKQIRLRVGIEVSDLIADARDVYGHGVNMAARLATLAGPGEVVVSATMRDRLTLGIDGDLKDLGDCFVKNLKEPIRAYRVGPPGAGLRLIEGASAGPLLASIAVVPFDGPPDDPEFQILGDVLADDVIETLSRSQSINLISRLSTSAFRGRHSNVAAICHHLKAHYVLSGSYRRWGGSVRLATELVDCSTAAVVWAQSFEFKISDVEAQKMEVVAELVQKITTSVAREELRRARLMPLPNLHAHTLLLAAVTLLHRNTLGDFNLARDLLQELISRVPRHPIPQAWMAHWQVLKVQQGWSNDILRDGNIAMDHTRRALDVDPDCAPALTIDGLVNTHFLKRLDVAQERYEQAVEANPSSALAWLLKGTLHAFMDQGAPAVADTTRALALSPLDPHRYYYESLAATANLAAGNNQRALHLAQRSLRSNRKHTSTLRVILNAQWRLGQHEAARETTAELLKLEPGLTVSGWLNRTPSASYKLGKEFAEVLRSVGVPD